MGCSKKSINHVAVSTIFVKDIEQPLNSEPSRSVHGSLNRGSRNTFGGNKEVEYTLYANKIIAESFQHQTPISETLHGLIIWHLHNLHLAKLYFPFYFRSSNTLNLPITFDWPKRRKLSIQKTKESATGALINPLGYREPCKNRARVSNQPSFPPRPTKA